MKDCQIGKLSGIIQIRPAVITRVLNKRGKESSRPRKAMWGQNAVRYRAMSQNNVGKLQKLEKKASKQMFQQSLQKEPALWTT